MEPKPLFPNKVTKSVNDKFKPTSPMVKQAPPKETKGPLRATFTPPVKSPPKAPPPVEPKALFPDKGVSFKVPVEEFYANHPLCVKLSNKDKARVRNMVQDADLHSAEYVLNYGLDLRTTFAGMVDRIVQENSAQEQGSIHQYTQMLVAQLANSAPHRLLATKFPSKLASVFIRVLGVHNPPLLTTKSFVDNIKTQIELVESLIDTLRQAVTNTLSRLDHMEDMFRDNRDNFVFLNLHLIAGKIIIDKHENEILPKMKRKVDETDMFQVQEYNHYKDDVDRFKRKVFDIELTIEMVLSNVPLIQLMKTNIKDTADRMQRVTLTVVPAWKQRMTRFWQQFDKVGTDDVRKALQIVQATGQSTIASAFSAHNELSALFTK